MGRGTPDNPRGFTLLEVVTTVAITAILLATAIPSLGLIDATRRATAADEAAQLFIGARSVAMGRGIAAGVVVSTSTQTLEATQITVGGGSPGSLVDAFGETVDPLHVPSRFPGVALTSVTLGDGGSGSGAVWFDHDGLPYLRTSSGVRGADASADTVLTFSGGHVVRVRAHTGAVVKEAAP